MIAEVFSKKTEARKYKKKAMVLPMNDKIQSAESKSGRFLMFISEVLVMINISGKNKVKRKATDSQTEKNQNL